MLELITFHVFGSFTLICEAGTSTHFGSAKYDQQHEYKIAQVGWNL